MSGLTKMRPTENDDILRAIVPSNKREKAVKALQALGCIILEDSIPWQDAFPEVNRESLPGICLRGAREKEGLTQIVLSKQTGIPQRHISEMENGKRPIGKKNAQRFAKALKVGWRIFL